MKEERLQVRVPSTLKRKAASAAKRRGVTLSAVVNNFLIRFVEADEEAQAQRKEVESI